MDTYVKRLKPLIRFLQSLFFWPIYFAAFVEELFFKLPAAAIFVLLISGMGALLAVILIKTVSLPVLIFFWLLNGSLMYIGTPEVAPKSITKEAIGFFSIILVVILLTGVIGIWLLSYIRTAGFS